MRYKWIKIHPGYAYFIGDVCELPDNVAGPLLELGYIIRLEDKTKRK